METATRIHAWNARWTYPALIVCDDGHVLRRHREASITRSRSETFAGDGNNQWADQDANDAWTLGQTRRLAEAIPTAEKFATIAQVVTGGGYPWTDIYQAYHRLLAWHEHTNAIDVVGPSLERMRPATELKENREMILEASQFAARPDFCLRSNRLSHHAWHRPHACRLQPTDTGADRHGPGRGRWALAGRSPGRRLERPAGAVADDA